MSDITLSAGVRQNLLSLQQTSDLLLTTQNRLATGKSVNSALDNPTNFFTSESLGSRAGELSNLLDSIGNATKTIEAADNGISAITSLVQSAQSTVNQASNNNTDATGVEIQGTLAIDTDGQTAATTQQRALDQTLGNLGFVDDDTTSGENSISVTATTNGTDTTASFQIGTGTDDALSASSTVQDLVNAINDSGVATASVTEDGRLTLQSNTAEALTLSIASNDSEVGTGDVTEANLSTAATGTAIAGLGFSAFADAVGTDNGDTTDDGNTTDDNADPGGTEVTVTDSDTGGGTDAANDTVTATIVQQAATTTVDNTEFVTQYNEILDQIDELARDASFNGVNLINSDSTTLEVAFNEERGDNASSLTIAGTDLTSSGLSLTDVSTLDSTEADAALTALSDALSSLESAGSRLGSNLNTVTIREDFTKAQINTLQTGADNLVLADTNEEGANLLALQTRQSLSTTALSLSAQADQAVLRLL